MSLSDMSPLRRRYQRTYWDGQANPNSGRSRLLVVPLLVAACYRRDWRLFGGALLFSLVGPFVFPVRDEDSSSWFTRASRASEAGFADGDAVFTREWPAVLNVVNVPVFLVAVYAIYKQRPVLTAVSTAGFLGVKLWYLNELVGEYDRQQTADNGST